MSIDVGVEFVLNQLAEIIKNNHELYKSLDKNIDTLHTELDSLKSLVKDLQKPDQAAETVKTFVKQVKKIIWQSEDVVEALALKLVTYKPKKLTNPLRRIRTKWEKANEVKSIIEKIQAIRQQYLPSALKLAEGSTSTGTSSRHAEPHYLEEPVVEENNIIGFEGAIEDVEKLVYEGGKQLEVTSIVGMLGLGKTTLANKVFINPKNVGKFMIRAFVNISKDYNKRSILVKILQSFTQVDEYTRDKMSARDLQSLVRKELESTTYLIVLDDVWSTKTWDDLKDAFPTNNNVRCRVIITTRDAVVAEYACGGDPSKPYKLKFLTTDKSRELLCRRVFNTKTCPNPDLLVSELTIATKCSGLPLAIVVIAGILLSHKHNVAFWKEVATHGKSIEEDEEKVKQMTGVVKLMYKHLPDYLKLCFLYLGVFPEDSDIPVWKLVRLWIAEGIVQSREGVSMELEDRAEACLQQLVSRNLVIVAQRSRNDMKIKSVRIHDSLRDFCMDRAREDCEFHEIVRKKDGSYTPHKLESLSECRRLLINDGEGIVKYISEAMPLEYVRSFLTFSSAKLVQEASVVAPLPSCFKVLRVLEIKPIIFTQFPARLTELSILKYISISLAVNEIPGSFSAFVHMQTLIVSTTYPSLVIRADIWKMPNFRHLHTNVSTILPTPKEDEKAGGNIQTLSTISPQSCTGKIFEQTRNTRKLGIRGNLAEITARDFGPTVLDLLCHFKSLENLKLCNDQSLPLTGLPSHDNLPQRLTKITLINTRLEWSQISKLGKLEALVVLNLKDHACQGPEWRTTDGHFPSLRHLNIEKSHLSAWEVASPNHFPRLGTLILNSCEKLDTLPPPLAEIPSLQSLSLHYTNARLVASARDLLPSTVQLYIQSRDSS